jgi:hypothetical protein
MRRIFVSDKSFIFAIQIVDACEDLHKIAVAAIIDTFIIIFLILYSDITQQRYILSSHRQ